MGTDELDRTRAVWKARILRDLAYGTLCLLVAFLGVVIILADGSVAGMLVGFGIFSIFITAGLMRIRWADRIRLMGPEAWFATQPRPEDEPKAKMR